MTDLIIIVPNIITKILPNYYQILDYMFFISVFTFN